MQRQSCTRRGCVRVMIEGKNTDIGTEYGWRTSRAFNDDDVMTAAIVTSTEIRFFVLRIIKARPGDDIHIFSYYDFLVKIFIVKSHYTFSEINNKFLRQDMSII